nr:putative fbd-associated f-box protein [Quercus suber]
MNSISTLISGCPVLEDLSVVRVCTNVIILKIKVHTLKRLHIGFKSYKPEPPDYNLEIHTPALEYFRLSGHLRNIVFHEKLAHLIEARIDIYALEDWTRVYEIYYGDRIFKLLRALNNAKFLSLFSGDRECIAFGSIYPSMFQNLVRLNFKVTPSNWHVLLALLLVAPNLEVLVVNKDYDNENRLCWMELPDAPGCLSSCLKTFNFDGFEELEHEVKLVMYILKEARALNTMTIKIPAKLSKEDVFETLSMFPRLSTTCLITVEKDNSLE